MVLLLWLLLGAQEAERVWTCPVHREITETVAGECPICNRELEETFVRNAYSCPIHPVVSEELPGQCPICGRALYLVSLEVSYACPMHPEVRERSEGSCPICHMALVAETSTRPHQDHYPKHGGIFFMAPDNWHHLEGAYPEEGVFRVYLYDNFSQSMDARRFRGRAVLEEEFDAELKQTRELVAHPLVPAPDGGYLEARVGKLALPREVTAKIQFASEGPFERFDFVFADLSREGESAVTASDSSSDALVIPEAPADIAVAIVERNEIVRDLVATGAFAEVYVPALEAKELAIALEGHVLEAPSELRSELEWAVRQLVRSAWLLDDYGDLGNREKVLLAYRLFDEATEGIQGIYAK
ncbi:MAG TPA: heavy metal-binding domain-containing protein [Vicinamibacteria bacterium]|nr:heavy metal-binding domain-containing protein [Vicinamibacteria bacterium]